MTQIHPPDATLTHSPFYDCKLKCLFYVDFFAAQGAPTLFSYDPKTGKFTSATITGEGVASFIIPVNECNNRKHVRFAVGLERSVKIVDWDCISSVATVAYTLFEVEKQSQYARNSFFFASVDPTKKRLYAATYRRDTCSNPSAANSSLYSFDCKQGVKSYYKDLEKAPAGLDWYRHTNEFYHIESCTFTVYKNKWNRRTGDLGKVIIIVIKIVPRIDHKFSCYFSGDERIAYDASPNNKRLTYTLGGMAIDKYGLAYIAKFNGSGVAVVDLKLVCYFIQLY